MTFLGPVYDSLIEVLKHLYLELGSLSKNKSLIVESCEYYQKYHPNNILMIINSAEALRSVLKSAPQEMEERDIERLRALMRSLWKIATILENVLQFKRIAITELELCDKFLRAYIT